MERQTRLFEQKIEEVHSCKMKVQEQKLAGRRGEKGRRIKNAEVIQQRNTD